MKSKFKFLIVFFLILFTIVGCKSNNEKGYYDDENGTGDVVEETEEAVPNRKIIYEVNANIKTDDVTECVERIKNNLNTDEWLDLEEISIDYATLIIRVKSDRLDDFLNAIKQNQKVSNFHKTATDISLKYQDKTNLLLTFQAERDRLLELYENASLSDMLTINQRISKIDIEMSKLRGELNQFDSLSDYSVVTLYIRGTNEIEESNKSFGERVWDGFTGGFNALLSFLEVLVIMIVAILPWAVVIVPIVYIIYRYKKNQKKKHKMNQNDNREDTNK